MHQQSFVDIKPSGLNEDFQDLTKIHNTYSLNHISMKTNLELLKSSSPITKNIKSNILPQILEDMLEKPTLLIKQDENFSELMIRISSKILKLLQVQQLPTQLRESLNKIKLFLITYNRFVHKTIKKIYLNIKLVSKKPLKQEFEKLIVQTNEKIKISLSKIFPRLCIESGSIIKFNDELKENLKEMFGNNKILATNEKEILGQRAKLRDFIREIIEIYNENTVKLHLSIVGTGFLVKSNDSPRRKVKNHGSNNNLLGTVKMLFNRGSLTEEEACRVLMNIGDSVFTDSNLRRRDLNKKRKFNQKGRKDVKSVYPTISKSESLVRKRVSSNSSFCDLRKKFTGCSQDKNYSSSTLKSPE